MLDILRKTAIVGTAQATATQQPATGTALDEISTQLPEDQRERTLLLTAGAFDIYKQAGQRTGKRKDHAEPAAEEKQTCCSKHQANLIATLLVRNLQPLLPEALERLQVEQLRVPYHLLTQLLQYGSEHRSVRAMVLSAIGERGYWLAQQNPDWRWVTQRLVDTSESDETIWQEGVIEQRLQVLQKRRAVDPDGARLWVEDIWVKEHAEVRLLLLSTMKTRLSIADVPFLTQALSDRSAKVREGAADLLLALPETPQAQLLRQCADELLTYNSGRGSNGEIIVTPFDQLSPEWKKDVDLAGVMSKKSTQDDWITRAVAFIPPEHWEKRFDVSAETLLAALENDPWAESLTHAWMHAAILHHSSGWYQALLKKPLEQHTRDRRGFSQQVRQLIAQMPQEVIEAVATTISSQHMETFDYFMTLVPEPWSLSLSQTFLGVVQRGIADHRPISSHWYQLVHLSGTALHPEAIDFALQPDMYPAIDYESSTQRSIENLRLRKRIQEEI